MQLVIAIVGGLAAGCSMSSIGSPNHPDESCTATAAQVTVMSLGAP